MGGVRPRLAWVLIIIGALLVLRPLGQWLYAQAEQQRLGWVVAEEENPRIELPETDPEPPPPTTIEEDEPGEDAADDEPVVPELPPLTYEPGDVVGRIVIPKLNVDAVILYGTATSLLAKGPGVYPEGNLPGAGGNLAIAGHRTTYGAWFRHVDRMQEGDEVTIIHHGVHYIYATERVFVVARNDWSVIAATDYAALTLTSCHPPGSDRERIVLRARLQEIVVVQESAAGTGAFWGITLRGDLLVGDSRIPGWRTE